MKQHVGIEKLRTIFTDLVVKSPEIQLVYLFGSRIEKYLGPLSDYDFGVFCDRAADRPELRGRLFHHLAHEIDTKHIDVVLLNDVPIELAFSIISYGQLLYERDVKCRVEYEARVMGLYFDYLPILRAGRRDILKGAYHATRVQRYRKAFRRTQRTLGQIRAPQR
jgi:predicted nucleotidyltransferase